MDTEPELNSGGSAGRFPGVTAAKASAAAVGASSPAAAASGVLRGVGVGVRRGRFSGVGACPGGGKCSFRLPYGVKLEALGSTATYG